MDSFNLQRFVEAQQPAYDKVVAELRIGDKRTHWIWFIFPQIQGLGSSAMSQKYAISSLAEARAYLDHPILGARLRECTGLVNAVENKSATDIFGSPDNLKFRSSMTLFAEAAGDNGLFQRALDKYFDGQADELTLEQLSK